MVHKLYLNKLLKGNVEEGILLFFYFIDEERKVTESMAGEARIPVSF